MKRPLPSSSPHTTHAPPAPSRPMSVGRLVPRAGWLLGLSLGLAIGCVSGEDAGGPDERADGSCEMADGGVILCARLDDPDAPNRHRIVDEGDGGLPLPEPLTGRHLFPSAVPGRSLAYYGTTAIEEGHATGTHALIMVHGTGRTAESYFNRARTAVEEAGLADDAVVIAPHFMIDDDAPASDILFWDTNGGWKRGDLSSSTLSERQSSYAIIDAMLMALGDRERFPELREVVIAGHSAGGQFVQRFAMGSRADLSLPRLRFRYVPANPSSYAYLDELRPAADSPGEFTIPPARCTSYNEWKYGLDDLNSHMSEVGAAEARQRYRARDVIYVLGDRDDDPESPDLDRSCSGNLQGPERLSRGLSYFEAVANHYGEQPHRLFVVPGVGHTARIFSSELGLEALFGP